jgi:hypothetical protein
MQYHEDFTAMSDTQGTPFHMEYLKFKLRDATWKWNRFKHLGAQLYRIFLLNISDISGRSYITGFFLFSFVNTKAYLYQVWRMYITAWNNRVISKRLFVINLRVE